MEAQELEVLYDAYHRRLAKISCDFVRYLYGRIDWKSRIIGIKGARGVGKTTLLLQRILFECANPDETIYVSLDDIWFNRHSLLDLVDYLYTHGVTCIFIDEVHHYEDWAQAFKNIYDQYPDMKIVYTGSCLLEIDNSKYDLSRRQVVYELAGLSFREYLELEGQYKMEPVSLETILTDHVKIAMDVTSKIKILPSFDHYLKYGYYPFYRESISDFHMKLKEVVNTVIESDIPSTKQFEYRTLGKIKTLLAIIAGMVPFVPNMKVLFEQIETDRNLGLKMLYTLDQAKLINLVTTEKKNYKNLVKPDKILLGDSNLMYALAIKTEIGTVRETFFVCQTSVTDYVISPDVGDFLVGGKHLFEVGGKDKSFSQIKDIPDSWLAVADTEVGHGNRIPLWLLGMMY